MVNVGGRPRVHDRDQIALDMVEWAKKDDSINLNHFCCTRNPPMAPSKITLWAKENESFREAYEATKAFIGHRREQKLTNNELHVKAYDLNAKVYDHFLKEEYREQLEFESKLKTEKDNLPESINAKQDEIMAFLKDSQASSKPKIPDTNTINE